MLMIEDDSFLRDILVRKFSLEGFAVESANSGKEALALLAKKKPAIILLDLILPEMDGFAILTHIKGDPNIADVPVIVLSNLGQKDDIDRARKLGAKDFMVKANFTPEEIVEKVYAILGKKPAPSSE